MSVKSDKWITKMANEHGMIEPFEGRQVRDGVISYGVSSYGYDMRVADEFKIFTNVNSSIVDPKHFDPKSFVEFKGSVCNSFPGLKRTALPGGMLTCWPVRGLRPMPVLRGFTLKTPNLRNSMRSPRPSAFFMASKTVSTACSALVRVMLVFDTIALTMSSLITKCLPLGGNLC